MLGEQVLREILRSRHLRALSGGEIPSPNAAEGRDNSVSGRGGDRYGTEVLSGEHEPGLNDDDLLSLWVGRVARTHALLEYGVDNVYRLMACHSGQVSARQATIGMDQLTQECRTLLKASDVGVDIAAAGDAALKAAREATAKRNRVVHDMWLPAREAQDGRPNWATFRRSGDLTESYSAGVLQALSVVVDTHALLVRTRLRVSGLFMALHVVWPARGARGGESPTPERVLPEFIALMTDRFVLHENGDYDIV